MKMQQHCIAVALTLSTAALGCAGNDTKPADVVARCGPARPATPGSERRTFTYDGIDREYELSIPESYDGSSRVPLLLSLHGFTSNIEQQDGVSRFPVEATQRGYVVVTPQALDVAVPLPAGTLTAPLWNIVGAFGPVTGQPGLDAEDDVGFLFSLLDSLETSLCIDTRREYVSGLSNGAGMTMVLICEDDQRFAGAAPVAGVNLTTLCGAERATPMIAFHGDADPLVNYDGGSIFGFDLDLPSVEGRLRDFAALAGCDPTPAETAPFSDIRHLVWTCPQGSAVEFYRVVGGGHSWPGARSVDGSELPALLGYTTQSIDATNLMLDFFDAQRRDRFDGGEGA